MTLGAGKKSIRITANADEYDFVRKRAGRFGKTSESAKSLFSLGSLLVKSGFNESVLEREDRDRIIDILCGVSSLNEAGLQSVDKILVRSIDETGNVTSLRGKK